MSGELTFSGASLEQAKDVPGRTVPNTGGSAGQAESLGIFPRLLGAIPQMSGQRESIRLSYATVAGATGDIDYTSDNGVVNFLTGQITGEYIVIEVKGDRLNADRPSASTANPV